MREKVPNLDLVENCIIRFIQENKNNSLLSGLPLNEDSVKGRKGKIQKDIWCVGEWNIYLDPPKIIARWSIEWTPEEETVINLNIKEIKNEYQILDWDVEETF
ncbi:MAG: hypothetical protein HWN67_02515 [Candidatus Helarchaeota archaeon]|nr:hypothetical protein [Candidatus Helarchaeota archaeon]